MDRDPHPNRKRPVHLPALERRNRSIIHFVTICTKDRRRILAEDTAHRLILDAWKAAKSYCVGRYMIMPDHIHLFCSPGTHPEKALGYWIDYWKSIVAKNWHRPLPGKLWQRSFWDRQLRSGESYSEKWAYVKNNPVRAGLVAKADAWPFQGEIDVFRWHD